MIQARRRNSFLVTGLVREFDTMQPCWNSSSKPAAQARDDACSALAGAAGSNPSQVTGNLRSRQHRVHLRARRIMRSMPRYLRYLRIAFSTTCGITAVLLVVLWVRSYYAADSLRLSRQSGSVVLASGYGGLSLLTSDGTLDPGWKLNHRQPDFIVSKSRFRFGFQDGVLGVPHWFAVISAATVAAVPWISQARWRFSLRTLLIATALIALVLGTIVWLSG
jgi:hypothetical protein